MEEETHEEQVEEQTEEESVDVVEVSLTAAEIDAFVAELLQLKEQKNEMTFDIADDMDILIRYEEESEEDEAEEESMPEQGGEVL